MLPTIGDYRLIPEESEEPNTCPYCGSDSIEEDDPFIGWGTPDMPHASCLVGYGCTAQRYHGFDEDELKAFNEALGFVGTDTRTLLTRMKTERES